MGNIHINVQMGQLTRNPKQKILVSRFAELFDITFGKEEWIPDYPGCAVFFLKPTGATSEQFGLTKEVLLFYSPHSEVTPVLFRHVAEMMDQPMARGRVERVCFVLIAPVKDLAAEVARIQDHRTQSALTVAFTTEELEHNLDPWLLKTRFSERLFSRDLFDMEQALVSDSYFFGRESFGFELRDRFRRGENTGLYGLRKSGKTSSIFKLQRLIQTDNRERLIYFDAQTPEIYSLRWWEFLSVIKDRVASALSVTLPHPYDRSFTEKTAISRFRTTIDEIFKGRPLVDRVLIAIDEVEHICPNLSPNRAWDEDFLPFWKLLRSVQTSNRQVAFLIVGVNATASERTSINDQDNPLFSLVSSRYMPPFDRDETATMVQRLGRYMGINFTQDACTYLCNRYGGHPLLIRLACSWEHQRLVQENKSRPTTVNSADLARFEQDRETDKVQYVNHIVDVLSKWYQDEYFLLQTLAAGKVAEFREYSESFPEAVQHLRAYNLIRDPGPRISIGMVEAFFKLNRTESQTRSPSRPAAGHESGPSVGSEDWLHIVNETSSVRNRLEIRLRKFIRQILVSQMGVERWIDPVTASLPEERRKRLVGVHRDTILHDNLFFLDLLRILEREWPRFQHLEHVEPAHRVTKSQLNVLMEFVNSHRADAHAKELSQAERTSISLACKALDDAIGRYID